MPQAYPPQRGVGKRAAKDNARTASLAVELVGSAPVEAIDSHSVRLEDAKKAAPDVDRGPHALAATPST